MERSYLIQRLEKPFRLAEEHPLFGKDNPFSFGGGLHNGGLSEEAMNLTRSLWQYDYMGAAEYEWGAVPEALQKLVKADKLGVASVRIPLKDVPPNWRDKSKEVPEGEGEVFILGPMDDLPEISERVIGFATNSYPENVRDSPRLDSALRPFDEWDGKICGWLELDNGYMFFTDREMFEGACALFGIAVGATL